jgi:hypothetical protein
MRQNDGMIGFAPKLVLLRNTLPIRSRTDAHSITRTTIMNVRTFRDVGFRFFWNFFWEAESLKNACNWMAMTYNLLTIYQGTLSGHRLPFSEVKSAPVLGLEALPQK